MRTSPIEKIAIRMTRFVGSPASLVIHTLLFTGAFILVLFGIPIDRVLLVLTTIVSLEAIYLSIFIQMSVNRSERRIARVSREVHEIAEDVEGIEADVAEIQEDVAGIETDIDEIQSDVENIETDIDEIQKDIEEIEENVDEIAEDVESIETDIDEIQKDS